MKKIFSTLALAACALVASAQVLIPSGFNYQGHTSEPNGTHATFNILKDGVKDPVYSQTETLKVTANGTFTVVIGNDENEAWNTINWGEGGYTIQTVINDVVVSSAKLQYVPYAAYATDFAGREEMQQDIYDLSLGLVKVQTDVAEWNAAKEGIEGAIPLVQQNVDDIEALQKAVELLYSEEDGPVASLTTGFTQLSNVVADQADEITAINEGLATTQDDVMNLTLKVKEYQTPINEWILAQENIEAAVPLVQKNVEDIEALQQAVELLYSEEDGPVASLTTGFTQLSNVVADQADEITAINEGLATTQDDVMNLTLKVKEYQTPINEWILAQENIEAAVPLVQQNVEDIEALQAGLGVVEDDVRELVDANRARATETAELRIDLMSIAENGNKAGEIAVWAAEQINDEINPAIEAVSSDVQGLTEKMRGLVTIDVYNADMANIDENVVKFNEIIDTLLEQKDATDEAIANVTSDVQGIMEKMRGLATIDAVNEVEATLMNVAENANMAAQTAQAAYDKADSLQDAIDYVTSDVQGIMEVLRGKADVEDYTSMKEAIDELRRQIANNAAAIAGLTALINR